MLRIGVPVRMEVELETLAGVEHLVLDLRPPDRAFLETVQGKDAAGLEAAFDPETLARYVLAWDGLADHQGEPLPLCPESLALVRDRAPTVYGVIVDCLFRALAKRREENRGN